MRDPSNLFAVDAPGHIHRQWGEADRVSRHATSERILYIIGQYLIFGTYNT